MKMKWKCKSFFAMMLAICLMMNGLSAAAAGIVYDSEALQETKTENTETATEEAETETDALEAESAVIETETDALETETTAPETDTEELSEAETQVPLSVRFSAFGTRAFENVDIDYIIDDEAAVSSQMPSGLITDNLGKITGLTLPAEVKFEKAVMRQADATEIEITRIGELNGETYYSLADDPDTGLLLGDDETIVLYFKTVYQIKYIYDTQYGTITGKTEVFKGDDLRIQTKASDYYHVNSAKYSVNNGVAIRDLGLDSLGYSVIPAADIVGTVTIFVDFAKDAPYTFEMETDAILHGYLCAQCSVAEGTNQVVINDTKFTFEPGEKAVATLYSQNWSGGDEWILNKLTINGEHINTPFGYDSTDVGDYMDTVMKDGTKVRVKFEAVKTTDSHNNSQSKRHKYSVVVEGAKGDIKIGGNFKKYDRREVIVKGMTGIAQFAASDEDRWYKAVVPNMGYHYDYTLAEAPDSLVFTTTNYGDDKSRHVYVYDVKPGYNPYSVSVVTYYDGVRAVQRDENFPLGTDPAAIASSYTTNFRHWESFISDAQSKGYPYGFALKQNSSHNQMIYINANPYNYKVEYSLGGGEFSADALDSAKYATSSDKQTVTEKQTYTIEHGAVSTNMPMAVPAKDGYVFTGWKLRTEGSTVYNQNQQFIIDEDSIQYAEGDNRNDNGMKFVFEAIWEDASTSNSVPYTVQYYKESANGTVEVNGKKYELMYEADKVGVKGSTVVVIDDHHPGDAYELNEAISKIRIDALEYGVDDEIYFYYDLRALTHNLTIGKTVTGKYADTTRMFTINLTLKDSASVGTEGSFFYEGVSIAGVEKPQDGKVTFVKGNAQITLKHGQSIVLKDIPEGYEYTITEVDYSADGYAVTYTGSGAGTDQVKFVMEEQDEVVGITNTKDNSTGPETGVSNYGGNIWNAISLVSILVLAAGVFLARRKKSAV